MRSDILSGFERWPRLATAAWFLMPGALLTLWLASEGRPKIMEAEWIGLLAASPLALVAAGAINGPRLAEDLRTGRFGLMMQWTFALLLTAGGAYIPIAVVIETIVGPPDSLFRFFDRALLAAFIGLVFAIVIGLPIFFFACVLHLLTRRSS